MRPRGATACLLAACVASCAAPPRPADPGGAASTAGATAPRPGGAVPVPRADSRQECARALYEQARRAIQANAFAEGLDLLVRAHRLDPDSATIRDLYNDVSRVLNRGDEWSTGQGPAPSVHSSVLLGQREDLARALERIGSLIRRRDWADAAAELRNAASVANGIARTVAVLTEGRFRDAWREQGIEALHGGSPAGAALCLELALEAGVPAEAAGTRAREEALQRQIEECRALASATDPAAELPRRPFNRDVLPSGLRDAMTADFLAIIRSLMLVGDRATALQQLDLLLAISPDSGEPLRFSRAARSLPDFDPWNSEGTTAARAQQAYTRATALSNSACEHERRGRFADAARDWELAAIELRWSPFVAQVEERSTEAGAAAARCRRLAEDASR